MKKFMLAFAVSVLFSMSLTYPVLAQGATNLPSDLSWSNPVDVTNAIQVEKSNSMTGTFAVIGTTLPVATAYRDATNSPGQTSCYRVAYVNTSGVGPYAGPVCKTFPNTSAQAPATFGVK